jgi:hypothetical protein
VRDLGHFAAGETKVVTETQEGTLRKFVRVKETAPWAQMGGTHTLSRAGHTSHGYLCDFPPVANDDATTVPEDTSVRIDVAGNDTDREGALNLGSVAVVRGPARGTATVDLTGQVTYTPAADWNGTDVFEYQICDAGGLCDTATVTVTVEPVDDAPVAANDAATTAEDVPVAIDVLANDTDVDGNLDPRTVVVEPSPGNGTAWVDPMTGWVTYTPDPGTYGTVTFGYRVCDAGGLCALATVTIEVTPVDDPVRAVGDA